MPTKSWTELMADAGGSGGNYEPIPEGDYDFLIEDCEAKLSQNQKMMYVAKNKVESGPHAGRLVWHNHVISHENPNALAWFFRNMKVLGLGQEFFASNPSDHQVAEALKGKRFRGNVQIRKWQGQDKNEIKQFYTASSGALGNGMAVPQQAAPAAPAFAPAPAAPAPAPAPQFATPPPAAQPAPAPVFAAPPAAAQPVAPPPVAAEAAPPPPPPVQQHEAPPPVAPAEPPAYAPPAPPAPEPVPAGVGAAAQATGDVPPPPPF